MNPSNFDAVAKRFTARRLSRRQAVAQGAVGLAAAGIAAAGLASTAQAQEATPASTGEKIEFLFVQSFQSGSIAPKAGAEGTYTLTLEGGLGQTIYFSDRPARLVGAAPTPQVMAGLGFPPDNPPNAALVVETDAGQTELAVVELYSPVYDDATHTATYEVAVLEEWENELGVGFTQTPNDLAAFGSSFGAAHLFIDDCPDITTCYTLGVYPAGPVPGGPIGTCWNSWTLLCRPCNGRSIDDLQQLCNQTYPNECGGSCVVYAA